MWAVQGDLLLVPGGSCNPLLDFPACLLGASCAAEPFRFVSSWLALSLSCNQMAQSSIAMQACPEMLTGHSAVLLRKHRLPPALCWAWEKGPGELSWLSLGIR